MHRSDIPLLHYIEANEELPKINFGQSTRKHKKKYPFLYSILSKQCTKQLLSSNNFFITSSTLDKIQDYFDAHQTEVEGVRILKTTTLFTLTIPTAVAKFLILLYLLQRQ